jgi:hypothetical protein
MLRLCILFSAFGYIEYELKEDTEDGLHKVKIERINKEFECHWSAIDLMRNFPTVACKNEMRNKNCR